jgi:hypothetical protein
MAETGIVICSHHKTFLPNCYNVSEYKHLT